MHGSSPLSQEDLRPKAKVGPGAGPVHEGKEIPPVQGDLSGLPRGNQARRGRVGVHHVPDLHEGVTARAHRTFESRASSAMRPKSHPVPLSDGLNLLNTLGSRTSMADVKPTRSELIK